MRIPFGKYKGKDLRNIPHAYLDWVLTLENVSPELRDGIRQLLGYTREKFPSVERALRPQKGMKTPPRPKKEKRNQSGGEEIQRWLRLPENAADYELCLTAPVQEMAAAAERIRQRWEAGK